MFLMGLMLYIPMPASLLLMGDEYKPIHRVWMNTVANEIQLIKNQATITPEDIDCLVALGRAGQHLVVMRHYHRQMMLPHYAFYLEKYQQSMWHVRIKNPDMSLNTRKERLIQRRNKQDTKIDKRKVPGPPGVKGGLVITVAVVTTICIGLVALRRT